MTGRIVKNISNEYTVENISTKEKITLKPRGKFRYKDEDLKVGDMVEYDNMSIYKVLERKNTFLRPFISNIDYSIIVMSLKMPDINYELLDKFIINMEEENVTPIIIITKCDLATSTEIEDCKEKMEYYKKYYNVFYSSKSGLEKEKEFFEIINNKITVLSGQSGAGKSSLLNTFDSNLNLKTQDISLALNRGKHTTRYTELLEINNSYIADTPGFSSLDLTSIKSTDLKEYYKEFVDHLNECKYNQCVHVHEPGCIIKDLVEKNEILKSRYDSYIKFYNEIKEKEKNFWR